MRRQLNMMDMRPDRVIDDRHSTYLATGLFVKRRAGALRRAKTALCPTFLVLLASAISERRVVLLLSHLRHFGTPFRRAGGCGAFPQANALLALGTGSGRLARNTGRDKMENRTHPFLHRQRSCTMLGPITRLGSLVRLLRFRCARIWLQWGRILCLS